MKKIFLTLLSLAVLFPAAVQANSEGIAVIVNSDAITNSDVDSRMKMIAASTGMPRTPEMMDKLRPQIVEMLIEESLKMQEARRMKIKVSKEEVDGGLAEIAKNNNIPVDDFRQMITKSGIDINTMYDQIRAQIGWGKVVAASVRSKIEVTDKDIDTELEKIRGKLGTEQFKIAQIYLPVNNAKKEDDLRNFATKLASQLREQPEAFGKAAQQFSQAPGAKQGGQMGWVEKGQLPLEIDTALNTAEAGTIAGPIKAQNAYYILNVQEKRVMTEEMLPKREEVLQRIGTQRMERGARRLMMNLRSTAFIESRV